MKIHVRFGRIGKRFEENTQDRVFEAIEIAIKTKFTDEQRKKFSKGADEIALVNSGLEDTMANTYQEIHETHSRYQVDLRIAAFISAINKIAVAYEQRGIFP